jgi:hypothetical protein
MRERALKGAIALTIQSGTSPDGKRAACAGNDLASTAANSLNQKKSAADDEALARRVQMGHCPDMGVGRVSALAGSVQSFSVKGACPLP